MLRYRSGSAPPFGLIVPRWGGTAGLGVEPRRVHHDERRGPRSTGPRRAEPHSPRLARSPASRAAFRFTLAAFPGVLPHRVVAATALSLALVTVLGVVTRMTLRQRPPSPVTVAGAGPAGVGDWVLGNWFTSPGSARVSAGTVARPVARRPRHPAGPDHVGGPEPLHPVVGAWLLAAALLLVTAAIALTRGARPEPARRAGSREARR